jgi:hypothetical protein
MQKLVRTIRATVVAVAALIAATPTPTAADEIVFMTGPAGGTWYPLGGAMMQILERGVPGLSITLRPGAGLINIKAVSIGRADIAFGNVISTVDAIAGKPPFNEPVGDLCNLARLYPQIAHIVGADSSIESIADFAGKSVASLPRGNTNEFALTMMLDTYDLTYDDLDAIHFASLTDMVNMMKDGHVDAFSIITSLPSGAMMELSSAKRVRFLGIRDVQFERLRSINSGWFRMTMPAGTYPGQDMPVVSAGFSSHVLVSCTRVSEDLAYRMARATAEGLEDLVAVTAALKGLTVANLAEDVGVPMHPGAQRYYEEVGAL